MNHSAFPQAFHAQLAGRLKSGDVRTVSASLLEAGAADQVWELIVELQERSAKLSREAIDVLPEMVERCEPEIMITWMDVVVTLAWTSGAMTLKFLKESPRLLGVLDCVALRRRVLNATLDVADSDSEFSANCAVEFFRTAPELLLIDPRTDPAQWAAVGQELTDWNHVVGIEFIRECPRVAGVLTWDAVRPWVAFGMKLITENSLGQPDYLGVLEFFRTSPGLIGDVSDVEVRANVVDLGSTLADQSPETALRFLTEAPLLLGGLPSTEWRKTVLRYGGLLAERDAAAFMAYVRQSPEILRLCSGAESRHEAFETWFRGGMEVLAYSPEGARAFFALETSKALRAVEQGMNGVPLRDVARSLTLFAHMIGGQSVRIESLADATRPPRLDVRAEGPVVSLPSIMNRFSVREENVRCYSAMVAHEVGHLAFGTYRVDRRFLQALARQVVMRYPRGESSSNPKPSGTADVRSLADLFSLYPRKGVIQDLWMILEDARVEFLLQQEYPGLRNELTALSRAAVQTRSFLHGMTVREMVLDSLLCLLTHGPEDVHVRDDLRPVVNRCWAFARAVVQPQARNEHAIETADKIYQVLDDVIGSVDAVVRDEPETDQTEENRDVGAGPRASDETAGGYRPVTNWVYRGSVQPDCVRGDLRESDESGDEAEEQRPDIERDGAGSHLTGRTEQILPKESLIGSQAEDDGTQDFRRSVIEERAGWTGSDLPHPGPLPVGEGKGREADRSSLGEGRGRGDARSYVYPEWDGRIQDYRLKWCRVVERPGKEGSQDFARNVLEKHAPAMRVLRRYFETIRPTALRRVHGYDHGDDVELDAAVRWMAERKAGSDPSDRIYDRRDKRERQVAVAFLVDLSGSTGRQLETGTRRVIDVEKEGLVLLTEALEAIGDPYALYGFSGQGRHQVDFLVLKDFEDTRRRHVGQRIEAMSPLQQNRDGAAIRHAVQKLLRCAARHRLLMLLSDGRPLDGDYGEEYALEDTRMALREARRRGVVPFCLTVDRQASGYLTRMYGDVRYLVLSDVHALPEQLPRVYQRLTGR